MKPITMRIAASAGPIPGIASTSKAFSMLFGAAASLIKGSTHLHYVTELDWNQSAVFDALKKATSEGSDLEADSTLSRWFAGFWINCAQYRLFHFLNCWTADVLGVPEMVKDPIPTKLQLMQKQSVNQDDDFKELSQVLKSFEDSITAVSVVETLHDKFADSYSDAAFRDLDSIFHQVTNWISADECVAVVYARTLRFQQGTESHTAKRKGIAVAIEWVVTAQAYFRLSQLARK